MSFTRDTEGRLREILLEEWVRELAPHLPHHIRLGLDEAVTEICEVCEAEAEYGNTLAHEPWCFIGDPTQPVISVAEARGKVEP